MKLTKTLRRELDILVRGAQACLEGWEGSDPEVTWDELEEDNLVFNVKLNCEHQDISYATGAVDALGAEAAKLLNEAKPDGGYWSSGDFSYYDENGDPCEEEFPECRTAQNQVIFNIREERA